MVADAQDRPLPPEEIGEVLVRGEVVMKGYWRNLPPLPDAAQWLAAYGRRGIVRQDGFLTLRDRSGLDHQRWFQHLSA